MDKNSVEYRFIFDIDSAILHDLASAFNPENNGCELELVEHWVAFDTERAPIKGALIKKLTATKEVVDIEVHKLCPHCLKSDDDDLIELLQDYFLAHGK